MATLICDIEDCVHRSKRPLRKWHYRDGRKCYGCRLESVVINRIFDMDGEAEEIFGRENTAICANYKPKEDTK